MLNDDGTYVRYREAHTDALDHTALVANSLMSSTLASERHTDPFLQALPPLPIYMFTTLYLQAVLYSILT